MANITGAYWRAEEKRKARKNDPEYKRKAEILRNLWETLDNDESYQKEAEEIRHECSKKLVELRDKYFEKYIKDMLG